MNLRKSCWLLLIFLMITGSVVGQNNGKTNFVEGELLVQLKNHASLEKLLTKYESTGLTFGELISARFNIYLLKFNPSRTSNQDMLNTVRYDNTVINAQNNHFVTLRETKETRPNDSLYSDQWALENTGQNSGTAGADIDAINAWDFTTGGLTAHGDTIVVAIIDGGSELDHEDLDFWKNHAEIPDNNIDDDSNGFVDDYDGWNAYDHTDDIPIYNHGVHVCGIAAAKGNNEIGVSGVNWNLKILPVAGSSHTESIVVEALAYVYVVRERYNETDGEHGAFVVADNCSFGVNSGQPEDYPIWEAMYDSLGKIGVLSIGATANVNVDVDEVGDIPTAFTTDYLISVTNTNRFDEKYDGAAYGDTSIDLGAPGTHILSTRALDKYGYSSGTSMSAPMVTGVVALLYANADSSLLADYKNQPDEVALQFKEYILEGVDTISDLVGITVTGGRLNAYNSLSLMGNPPDPKPKLSVTPDLLSEILLIDSSLEDTLFVSNIGTDTLFYSIDIEGEPGWLSMSQDTGMLALQQTDTILLMFDAAGIDTGMYHTEIIVSGPEVHAATVAVEMYVYTDVGVVEIGDNNGKVTVYPNPFSTALNIRFNDYFNYLNRSAGFELFDQHGQMVISEKFRIESQLHQIETDISNPGVFFYRITIDNKKVKTGKLVRL